MPFMRENLGAAARSMVFDVKGQSLISVGLSGTFTGTLDIEASRDGGVNWTPLPMSTEPYSETIAKVTSFTGTGSWVTRNPGYNLAKLTMSSYGSGTATASIGAANDGSYADAYLTENQISRQAISTAGDTATLTVAPNTYHRNKITEIIVSWDRGTPTGTTLIVRERGAAVVSTLGQVHCNPVPSLNNISFGPALSQTKVPVDFVGPPNRTIELVAGSIALVTTTVNAKCTLV